MKKNKNMNTEMGKRTLNRLNSKPDAVERRISELEATYEEIIQDAEQRNKEMESMKEMLYYMEDRMTISNECPVRENRVNGEEAVFDRY